MDRGASDPAEIAGDAIERRDTVRRASTIEVPPALLTEFERRLDDERPAIEQGLGVTLGAREGTGFLRYPVGGFYKRHRDRGRVNGWPDAARRLVTVVVFLNGSDPEARVGFAGGELCVYSGGHEARISPRPGLLVAFLSKHLHEVLPVTAGTRDTAVDWFYDPA